jgi:hypothetical protein
MADTINVLRTLVNKSDVRDWSAANGYDVIEAGDTLVVGEYTLTFSEDGRLDFVEQRTPAGKPL